MSTIRAPICVVMGHIDHGKTRILDSIRGSCVVDKEAGGITQAISYSNISIASIKDFCGDLLETLKLDITLPGILFIDSPGHAAFTNLRRRGGNLADIAILVVDINEGIKPQTLECIEILKQYKTPFVVAANKIDLVPGFRPTDDKLILKSINNQSDSVKKHLDVKLYEVVGKLHELGFNSERFDRVDDFTKQIPIVPTAAKIGWGIPELLMVLTGIAQRFLEESLKCDVDGPGKATILEVKEEKGMGTTLDVILYDGALKVNDQIVIGGIDKAIVTKVKAMFDFVGNKFTPIKKACAATGLKVCAIDTKEVISGMPLMSVSNDDVEKVKEEVQKEINEVIIETDNDGIIIKADSLGSLEALTVLLREREILIKKASIGNISKSDIAEANSESDPLKKVILGFNVGLLENAENVKVITHEIIYKIIDDFEEWKEKESKKQEAKELDSLVRPCKIHIMPNYIFRESNPAVMGVEIILGSLHKNTPLMKLNGDKVAEVKTIQLDGKNIDEAKRGEQVAIALPKVTVGRQINEGDTLLADVPEQDFIKFKKFKKYLSEEERKVLNEISEIKRKENPVWGV